MENHKIVSGLKPTVGAAAALTGTYISLKNVQMAWVIFHYNQADATAITFSVNMATAVAPTGATQITNVVPIWSDLDCAAADTLTRQTDAVTYAAGTGQKDKLIVFQIDPARLGGSYDCIAGYTVTAIAATSWLEILYVLAPRYSGQDSTSPTVLTD